MKKKLSTGLEIIEFDGEKDFPTSESWENYVKQNPGMRCVCETGGFVYVANRNLTSEESDEFEELFMQ